MIDFFEKMKENGRKWEKMKKNGEKKLTNFPASHSTGFIDTMFKLYRVECRHDAHMPIIK